MNFTQLLSKLDAIGTKTTLSEATKTDKPWTDKSGKEHTGTAVKGDKYTGKEADSSEPGRKSYGNQSKYTKYAVPDEIEEGKKPDFLDMDKDGDKKEPMKKAVADKKAVKETTSADLMKRWVGIFEAEEKCADCGEVHKGECAEEVTEAEEKCADCGKMHEGDCAEEVKEAATKHDKPWTDKSGKKHPGTAVKGDKYTGKDAEKEEKAKKKVDEAADKKKCPPMSHIKKMCQDGKSVAEICKMHSDCDQKELKQMVADCKKKMNESLAECGDMMGSMGEEAESGMSINTNVDTRTGKKTVSVNADGEAADQLMQMLKMAGMGGHSEAAETEPEMMQAQPSMADHIKVISVPLAHQDGGFDFGAAGQEQEVEEEYANEHHTQTQPVDTQLRQGNDLNREKAQHKHGYRNGDNPLAMREAAELAQLEKSLFEELATIKITKAK